MVMLLCCYPAIFDPKQSCFFGHEGSDKYWTLSHFCGFIGTVQYPFVRTSSGLSFKPKRYCDADEKSAVHGHVSAAHCRLPRRTVGWEPKFATKKLGRIRVAMNCSCKFGIEQSRIQILEISWADFKPWPNDEHQQLQSTQLPMISWT